MPISVTLQLASLFKFPTNLHQLDDTYSAHFVQLVTCIHLNIAQQRDERQHEFW